jgi:hypothetical protein
MVSNITNRLNKPAPSHLTTPKVVLLSDQEILNYRKQRSKVGSRLGRNCHNQSRYVVGMRALLGLIDKEGSHPNYVPISRMTIKPPALVPKNP